MRKLPTKAFEINARWTAVVPVQGWRHYRISSLKHQVFSEKKELVVEMMAVCDREVRFWLRRKEVLQDENWVTGWKDQP